MRIAIAVQPWDRVTRGGCSGSSISLVAYNLAKQLAPRHDVHLIANRAPGEPERETDDSGITIHRIAVPEKPLFQLADRLTGFRNLNPPLFSRPCYYSRYARQVARIAREEAFDVLHLTTFLQHAGIARRYNPDTCIVLQMHDETLRLLPRHAVQPQLEKIDGFLSVSDFIRKGFSERFPSHAARCRTLHNGVDSDRFHPLEAEGTPENKALRILYVGRVSPEKGLHILLPAFNRVLERHPNCRLDIVGAAGLLPYSYLLGLSQDSTTKTLNPYYGENLSEKIKLQLLDKSGSYRNTLDKLATEQSTSRIHYHDALPNVELTELYQRATLFVFPSICHEAFGMPVTEAMSSGVPVVATESGGVTELVVPGKTGLLVRRNDPQSLGDALLYLLADRGRAAAMGERGRQRVLQGMTYKHAALTLERYYETLLAEKATGGYDQPCATGA